MRSYSLTDEVTARLNPSNPRTAQACYWQAPQSEWVFVNTDGSAVSQTPAACGGVLCDDKGSFLLAFAANRGALSITMADLSGALGLGK